MAQGAKPGEGGQLPGNKVWPWIAKTRHATPGVGLISPPPHHDIYSIEDLAQLIHDLKNVNPARGARQAGRRGRRRHGRGRRRQAQADVILISGHDGGTGASPLTRLKHAGTPWELGLAETQQTLLLNGLRDRVAVQVDGQLKTGRDVIIAALLGAEEFGFATAPLIVSGCIMMRVCHLDTCPVGIATQNPELRAQFTGKPEFVETFFVFLAEEVRELPGRAGLPHHRRGDRARRAARHPRRRSTTGRPTGSTCRRSSRAGAARGRAAAPGRRAGPRPGEGAGQQADRARRGRRWPTAPRSASSTAGPQRATAASARCSAARSPAATAATACPTTRSSSPCAAPAGQSFGAFLPRGVTLRLLGDANDYVGKGLSGGRLVRPARRDGAVRGRGEHHRRQHHPVRRDRRRAVPARPGRRAVRVRNSGATAVVEGVGDHGCEYMTGGTVVVLGPTGRNFAAGMSGGAAYVLDLDPARVNPEMVDLDPLTAEELDHAARARRPAPRRDRLGGGGGAARRLAAPLGGFTAVVPRDYKRVLEAIRMAERPAVTSTRRSWRQHVPDPTGFLRHEPRAARAPSGADPDQDWREVYPGQPASAPTWSATRPPAAWTAASRSATTAARSGNRIPDWNDLVRTDSGSGGRASARDEQLPGVHRAALPGAVRGRLRARHQLRRR